MTNEEIVLDSIKSKIKYRKLSPLKFRNGGQPDFDSSIKALTEIKEIEERIFRIVSLCDRYVTIHYKKEGFQCRSGAHRSVLDIMCIYKYYFGEIDLFTVMRVLYELVCERKISTLKCPNIRKQVFWDWSWRGNEDMSISWLNTELKIPFSAWRNIGVNE